MAGINPALRIKRIKPPTTSEPALRIKRIKRIKVSLGGSLSPLSKLPPNERGRSRGGETEMEGKKGASVVADEI
jgi:hypothetical protein